MARSKAAITADLTAQRQKIADLDEKLRELDRVLTGLHDRRTRWQEERARRRLRIDALLDDYHAAR
jgi:chromosome segregation ATPase